MHLNVLRHFVILLLVISVYHHSLRHRDSFKVSSLQYHRCYMRLCALYSVVLPHQYLHHAHINL